MTLLTGTCGDTLPTETPRPGGRETALPSTCGSGLPGAWPRAVGGTGHPLRKTFFLHGKRRHPKLPKIPAYLPALYTYLPPSASCAAQTTMHRPPVLANKHS